MWKSSAWEVAKIFMPTLSPFDAINGRPNQHALDKTTADHFDITGLFNLMLNMKEAFKGDAKKREAARTVLKARNQCLGHLAEPSLTKNQLDEVFDAFVHFANVCLAPSESYATGALAAIDAIGTLRDDATEPAIIMQELRHKVLASPSVSSNILQELHHMAMAFESADIPGMEDRLKLRTADLDSMRAKLDSFLGDVRSHMSHVADATNVHITHTAGVITQTLKEEVELAKDDIIKAMRVDVGMLAQAFGAADNMLSSGLFWCADPVEVDLKDSVPRLFIGGIFCLVCSFEVLFAHHVFPLLFPFAYALSSVFFCLPCFQ